MVNNSTNVNKTNNKLSPQTIEQTKKTTTFGVGNPGPGLRQAQKYDMDKPVNCITTLHFDTWILNGKTDINKR